MLDKDLAKFSERQLEMDYSEWQKEFLTYPNAIDYRDVASHQKETELVTLFLEFVGNKKLDILLSLNDSSSFNYCINFFCIFSS